MIKDLTVAEQINLSRCISVTRVVLSTSVTLLSGYLNIQTKPKGVPLLNSSLETVLYSTFPLLSQADLSTSPEATNTDVLISILLHCLFAHGHFASLTLNGEGPRIQSRFPGFKAGSVQDGALCGGKEQRCGYPPFTPQPEHIPQDFSHSFQRANGSETAVCAGYSLVSHNSRRLSDPCEQTVVKIVL